MIGLGVRVRVRVRGGADTLVSVVVHPMGTSCSKKGSYTYLLAQLKQTLSSHLPPPRTTDTNLGLTPYLHPYLTPNPSTRTRSYLGVYGVVKSKHRTDAVVVRAVLSGNPDP